MKIIFLIFILLNSTCFASYKLHVEALNDFNSIQPASNIKVKLIEDSYIEKIPMLKNDIINCELQKISNPKRAKQNAKLFYFLRQYEDKIGTHEFKKQYTAKLSYTILTEDKEKILKKSAITISSIFVKGLSYGVSFVEGVKDNEKNNRFISGVKRVYDDSFFSLVEYGEEISIKAGDKFYLIVKPFDNNED